MCIEQKEQASKQSRQSKFSNTNSFSILQIEIEHTHTNTNMYALFALASSCSMRIRFLIFQIAHNNHNNSIIQWLYFQMLSMLGSCLSLLIHLDNSFKMSLCSWNNATHWTLSVLSISFFSPSIKQVVVVKYVHRNQTHTHTQITNTCCQFLFNANPLFLYFPMAHKDDQNW